MSKAYDRIEWSFLQAVLKKLGFDEKWISWILMCVTSVSYSFLINGSPQEKVLPTRGLRQGDPLWPYLFILCIEVLSGLCIKAQSQGSLPGIKVSRASPPINHLLFADDTMFFCKSSPLCCSTISKILEKYESASGQRINFTKSTITFSSKTLAETKARVNQSLNITQEGGIGKYLGLLENFGMKKRDIFANIVDRIRQRSHSWSTRFLSGAGKQVLLKSILTALPTYAMSCFKLPVSLCKQIQSIFTRFWWDDKPDKKKMCWVAWDSLTQPKHEGGLGFCDVELFNDALLAKIGWRLIQNPDSLLAKVLFGKYCHSSTFLECSASPNVASHGWKSILVGREILKQGMGWVVGDGANINVWTDPWLSLQHPKTPFGPPPLEAVTLKVKDLLYPSLKDWNVEAIHNLLPQYEDEIRSLIPSSNPSPDSLIWIHDKSGAYTTKSGYTLAKSRPQRAPCDQFDWHKNIWKLKLPPKLKHFLWKVVSGVLSVGSNLSKRGILSATACKHCGLVENELHVLLNCDFADIVWNLAPVVSPPNPTLISTPHMLLQELNRLTALPPAGVALTPLAPWILWQVWKARNLLIFEDKPLSVQDILLKATMEARQWQEAQLSLKAPNMRVGLRSNTTSLRPIGIDSHVCFVDVVWNPVSGVCGLGWIVKAPDGTTLHKATATRSFVGSALIAEALAIRSALSQVTSLAHLSCIRSVVIFSDSQVLIKLLNFNGSLKELKGVLFNICCLKESFSFISFSFVLRLNNVEADSLSKSALFFASKSSLCGV